MVRPRPVQCDGMEPGGEAHLALRFRERLISGEKRILTEFLRHLHTSHQAGEEAEQSGLVPYHDQIKCLGVSSAQCLAQAGATVYIDGFTGALYLDKPREVEQYARAFGGIWDACLDETASRDLIHHAAEELRK